MKKLFIIILLLFLSGCGLQPPFGANEKTLVEKYNESTIKNKYQLDGATLKRAVKDDPKDMIRVEIGEQALGGIGNITLEPKLTISRWDEVSFSIKPKNYDLIASQDKTVSFDGDKTVFTTPKEDYKLYELATSTDLPEGGFEYEIDLKEKPASNMIELDIETQGLDFFYQPPLNVEMASSTCTETDCGRLNRPENVVGSYAVYASENKVNYVGGKEYKAGKVGHIYRPKIIDSSGIEIWGELNIDTNIGVLLVIIPQDFLDKAVYPVRHATGLTFGYTDVGATGYYNSHDYLEFTYPGYTGAAGTGNSMTSYQYTLGGTYTNKMALYYTSGANYALLTNGTANDSSATAVTTWVTANFSTEPTLTAITYIMMNQCSDNGLYLRVDSEAGYGAYTKAYTYGEFPATTATSGWASDGAYRHSVYVTYTASGEATATPDDDYHTYNN